MKKMFACLFLCLFASTANAGLIAFNDRSTFESYVSGISVDNLTGIGQSSQSSAIRTDYTVNGSMYGCVNGTGCSDPYNNMDDTYMWTYSTVIFSFTDDLTAFGFDFNSYNSKHQNQNFTATLNGLSSNSTNTGGFFGIATDDGSAFNNISFSKNLTYGLFDNVTYSSNKIEQPVPEPTSIALLVLGIAGIRLIRKNKVL